MITFVTATAEITPLGHIKVIFIFLGWTDSTSDILILKAVSEHFVALMFIEAPYREAGQEYSVWLVAWGLIGRPHLYNNFGAKKRKRNCILPWNEAKSISNARKDAMNDHTSSKILEKNKHITCIGMYVALSCITRCHSPRIDGQFEYVVMNYFQNAAR